jgi:hypothetical protein
MKNVLIIGKTYERPTVIKEDKNVSGNKCCFYPHKDTVFTVFTLSRKYDIIILRGR